MERDQMETLLLVPLDDSIVFPGMTVTLALDLGEESRVLLVPRTNGEFASVGTVTDVVDHIRLPGGVRAATVEGVARGIPGAARTDDSGVLRVMVTGPFDMVWSSIFGRPANWNTIDTIPTFLISAGYGSCATPALPG